MAWTDNPVLDAENYYNELEKNAVESDIVGHCKNCGEAIYKGESYYDIMGDYFCTCCDEEAIEELVPNTVVTYHKEREYYHIEDKDFPIAADVSEVSGNITYMLTAHKVNEYMEGSEFISFVDGVEMVGDMIKKGEL